MFAKHDNMDVTSDPARKRIREDEEEFGNASSFSEHRNKRVQCLPLRTSPKATQQILPSALTPMQAEHEPKSRFSPWSSSPAVREVAHEHDMEMDHPPNVSRFHPEPENTGRMPTPIQPSFAAQVRGQDWAVNGVNNLGHQVTGIAQVPRTVEADWQNVQSNRRLPSPISEAEDGQCTEHSHEMEHPNAMMDVETQAASAEDDPNSPSPRRMGHTRSKHTINNWTHHPGMKKSFSIGYRADCEKCRQKVPGHFNHIIIS